MNKKLVFKGELDLQNDEYLFGGTVDIDKILIDEQSERIIIHLSGKLEESGAFTAEGIAYKNDQNSYVATFNLKHGSIITNEFEKIIFTIDSYQINAKKTECTIRGSWSQPVAGEPDNVIWQFDDYLDYLGGNVEKNNDKYFVYVYRDARGNPVYVGQGKNINRSTQHLSESHNTKLKEWLNKNRETCVIEVIGPLGSKTLADQIETACISLIDNSSKSLLNNKHRGVTKFRFRPFGVPAKQVHRTLEFLEKKDFDNLTKTYGSLLFVKISGLNFENRGKGYDLLYIHSDNDI